jgi:hypothetical protein
MVNESYFYTHRPQKPVRHTKRRRVSEYDKQADKADIEYENNYGL